MSEFNKFVKVIIAVSDPEYDEPNQFSICFKTEHPDEKSFMAAVKAAQEEWKKTAPSDIAAIYDFNHEVGEPEFEKELADYDLTWDQVRNYLPTEIAKKHGFIPVECDYSLNASEDDHIDFSKY